MMGNRQITNAVLEVARVFRDGTLVGMSDRQILERFVENHDEMAFEAILTRHGPMVRRVCRQMLNNSHDVDDAVQAVFLVLVRKARWIRIEGSLGPWLYTVAGRVAARARADRRKRWHREGANSQQPEPSECTPNDRFEIPQIIHDELGRLPERLRAPVVLCYLEGLTHDLAARQLDCPVGTVRSRLARGRSLLHQRMTRRGLTLSAAALGGILESNARAAFGSGLPGPLIASISRAMVETLRHTQSGLSTSLATILGGMMNVSTFKRIAVLATVFSAGALVYALAERAKVAGQMARHPSRQIDLFGDYDPRPLGPDGRRIGTLPPRDGKTPYPKRYNVLDLALPQPPDRQEKTAGGPADDRVMVDVTALVDLIQIAVAPGSWTVKDEQGHELPRKAAKHGPAGADQRNMIATQLIFGSLIITCSDNVHTDIRNLLYGLRRLRNPRDESITGGTRLAMLVPRTAFPNPPDAKPNTTPDDERIKLFHKRLKELSYFIRELEAASD